MFIVSLRGGVKSKLAWLRFPRGTAGCLYRGREGGSKFNGIKQPSSRVGILILVEQDTTLFVRLGLKLITQKVRCAAFSPA